MKGKATHVDSSRPNTRRPRFHAHAEFWDADYTDPGRFFFSFFLFLIVSERGGGRWVEEKGLRTDKK